MCCLNISVSVPEVRRHGLHLVICTIGCSYLQTATLLANSSAFWMALQEVTKNIFTYGNILVQSFGKAVKYWDEKDLENALSWADYCSKVRSN